MAGQKAAAQSVATALILPPTSVVPYTTAAPVSSIGTAEVLIVVGAGPGQPNQHQHDLVHRQLILGRWPAPRSAADAPSPAVRARLAPLLSDPGSTAVLTDFDGTLSPIVTNPYEARPLDGAAEVMAHAGPAVRRGGGGLGSVRVVPRGARLAPTEPADPAHRVRLVGLYGLEQSWG